jgi:hypothetical protein
MVQSTMILYNSFYFLILMHEKSKYYIDYSALLLSAVQL